MITFSYPDLALLGGLDPAAGEVRGASTSVCPNACFPQKNTSVIVMLWVFSVTVFIFHF